MANDYRDENVIAHACEAFADTVMLKVQHLRRYIRKGTNPALTGQYIEEVVRAFVQDWIGHRQLLTGTFYSRAFAESGETPLQIDGIVYDPTSGPPVLRQGKFAVVHPAFCTSVIEIKTTWDKPLMQFVERLRTIYNRYFYHMTTPQVMGIIISDPDPEGKSLITLEGTEPFPAYHYSLVPWHPVFILFKEDAGEYTPHMPAIDAMIRAIYTNQLSAGNYL